jgi:RNA polymerase sigma-70 factor (ECF subfamily)
MSPPSPNSVRGLVDLAQQGDARAFTQLVESYRARLKALIQARIRARFLRNVDAQDVFQETCLSALESLSRFQWQGEESFLRWLGGIADHQIVDLARSQARRNLEKPLDAALTTDDVGPSKAAERNERFDRLQAALDSLSPDHRKVILLARLEKLPIGEIAQRMNRSPNAVSHLLLRAAQKMKQHMGETESLHLPDRLLNDRGSAHVE